MAKSEQTFANHKRYIPAWHFLALPVLALNMFVAAYRMSIRDFPAGSVWDFLVAVALFLTITYSRWMPMMVQNRIIRLEERARLNEKLPPELRTRLPDLTTRQLVALRFASDEELPELARKCLDAELRTGIQIKQAIKSWRPDNLRA